ncbi:hypothetical protein H5410_002544 [Solanum commersonii]|uniref:Uncharacterized protein n=1 Tax=Solanum commersonii TaxID=4109 RepID=A0A9J6B2J8_SOLCO|nr:hypothetical protein H5410_002544 [Solanum commersonii]
MENVKQKHTMCRSTGDVRRHIFQGFENLKIEVQQETNAVIETMKRNSRKERQNLESRRENLQQRNTKEMDTTIMAQERLKIFSTIRSTGDVRRHIFQGFENLKIEVQQEINAVIETMFGVGEKKFEKREREPSISENESAAKKHKRNGRHNHGTRENDNFLDDAWNNLMNWDEINKNETIRSTGDVRRHIFQGFENLKIEVQQETNAVIETMVGVGEKKFEKREREFSISERESTAKKHKRNGHYNHGMRETENFIVDAWNNLMNWDEIHKNVVTHVKATIRF